MIDAIIVLAAIAAAVTIAASGSAFALDKRGLVCVLCGTATVASDLNKHGECIDCLDHAEGGWGF